MTPRVHGGAASIGAAGGIPPRRAGAAPPDAATAGAGKAERLRATARQLEGVFVEQMFKAMRETVPDGGALSGGSAESMFTGMLDQSLAEEVPARWSNGLAEAVYRQLQQAAGVASSPDAARPILDTGPSTSAAPARALLTEPQ